MSICIKDQIQNMNIVIGCTVTKPLAEGMSIALEPKIAVPGIGMAGLEHTCLLTRQKAEILTGSRLSILALKN